MKTARAIYVDALSIERKGLPLRDIKEQLIDAGLEAGYTSVGAAGSVDVAAINRIALGAITFRWIQTRRHTPPKR